MIVASDPLVAVLAAGVEQQLFHVVEGGPRELALVEVVAQLPNGLVELGAGLLAHRQPVQALLFEEPAEELAIHVEGGLGEEASVFGNHPLDDLLLLVAEPSPDLTAEDRAAGQ